MDRKSQVQCLADCRAMLAKGASVLFFPEGTRSLDARLASFKKGAFTVAARAKVRCKRTPDLHPDCAVWCISTPEVQAACGASYTGSG